jgi:ATP-dependent helicase Lhr and Lhr-like helicase
MDLALLDPLVRRWFEGNFASVTEPQRLGWPQILAGHDVLISAPTGSGKTLAAFLMAIDALVRQARITSDENRNVINGDVANRDVTYRDVTNGVEVLYVSPLKALSNDVHKNLDVPLAGVAALARDIGIDLAPIRTAVRTGDTPAAERQAMGKNAPHILVTTPESLYILLTAEKSRKMLRSVKTLIVDEIHALADDKRGSHLALSIARLDALVGRRIQKIGLSATVSPIEEVARFLSPKAQIVQVGHRRAMDLAVEVPRDELGAVASTEMWGEIYDRVAQLAQENRTTLVFVNTRRLAERVAHHLAERLGEGEVLPHHGSLSRRLRLEAEQRLKNGELKAVVATASLELGIDIGSVDLVCQIGTPRAIAVALQRIGRAGHWVGALPKGRIFATTRDELIECAALVRAIRNGELDRLEIPETPLDILAQQIVAMCAAETSFATAASEAHPSGCAHLPIDPPVSTTASEARPSESAHLPPNPPIPTAASEARPSESAHKNTPTSTAVSEPRPKEAVDADIPNQTGWNEDELFALIRTAYPYRNLERKDFEAVVEMLSEGIATSRGRRGAHLHRDQVNHRLRARRGARLAAITSGGAIPDSSQYQVVAEPEGTVVGTLDEDFAIESLSGDVFLLGTTSWRIRRVEPGRIRVEDAHGAAPTIPFWNGEAPGRTRELSTAVSQLREDIVSSDEPVELLKRECSVDQRGAEQAVAYVRAGKNALGVVPSENCVVAERFFDEGGGMQLVIHAPFGSRINRAWGLSLRKRFCRTFNFELQAAATDNGLVLSLSDQHSFPLESVFSFLRAHSVEHVLTQALLDSPMFGARWKWNASRALAVLRFAGGKKVPPPLQRMRADDLLAAVFPDQVACAENLTGEPRIPDHPLVNETIANCLHEAMDVRGLIRILERMDDGSVKTVAVDTPEPSPFCHEILNANPYAYLDDAPLEERRTRAVQLRRTLSPEDASAIGALDPAAIAQAAEEAWPVVRDADELHDALLTLFILPPIAEWQPWFEELRKSGRSNTTSSTIRKDGGACDVMWVATERLERINEITEIVRGWMDSIGPVTAPELAQRLSLPQSDIEIAFGALEAEGQILRGRFSAGLAPGDEQFCHRRILARIHRLTLGRLRREIEPISSAMFMRFLCRWQHLAPGTQMHGVDGLFQVLRQLQGYEISAAAWESAVLPRRIANYDPELLDRLCLAGEVMWGRLSPHPAFNSQQPAPSSPADVARVSASRDVAHASASSGELQFDVSRRVRPTRVAPLSIFLREDASRLLPSAPPEVPLSHPARDVLSALERRGASFFNDLVRDTGRLASEIEDGLWELSAAGRVTADGFENLRALIDPKRRAGQGRGRFARPRHATGRWALLDRGSDAIDVEFFARQLLDRWGVVFRDLLAREILAPPWRDLLVTLRRMEARGEIRGGRFVSGFVGEQFARPEAVDLLRHIRRSGDVGEEIEIALADPLNLTGIILPGPRTSALAQGSLRLFDGAQRLAPTGS